MYLNYVCQLSKKSRSQCVRHFLCTENEKDKEKGV